MTCLMGSVLSADPEPGEASVETEELSASQSCNPSTGTTSEVEGRSSVRLSMPIMVPISQIRTGEGGSQEECQVIERQGTG